MKRVIIRVVVLAVLAGGALALWGPLRAARDAGEGAGGLLERIGGMLGIGAVERGDVFSGYVEAEYVYVTSSIGGTLMRLDVERGRQVEAGAPLFALDVASEQAAAEEATADSRQAQLDNLRTGRRQPEIDAILAQRAQAEAALRLSEAEFARQTQLRATGVVAQQRVDEARAQRGVTARASPGSRADPRRADGGARGRDPRRRGGGVDGARDARPGGLARPSCRGAAPGARGRHALSPWRDGAGRHAGRAAAAARQHQDPLLRAAGGGRAHRGRAVADRGLRRLPGAGRRDGPLYLAARRVHAAGDLQPRAARAHDVHGRGAAVGRGRRPSASASRSTSLWRGDERASSPFKARRRRSACADSPSASAARPWSRTSPSTCSAARSSASSGPTAAARRRRSECCGLLTPDAGEGTCLGFDIQPVGGDQAPRRLHDPALRALRGHDGAREPRIHRPHVRRAPDQGAYRGDHRALRLRQARGPARGRAVGRLEAAPRARGLRAARARAAAARRADRRRRSQRAARVLGDDPRPRRRRRDRAGEHALHGRGRALPPHRLSRLGQAAARRAVGVSSPVPG